MGYCKFWGIVKGIVNGGIVNFWGIVWGIVKGVL